MSEQGTKIEAKYGHLYGDPQPVQGGFQVSSLAYAEWMCECGEACRCYEYVSLTMEYLCACERRYQVDWAHGIEPRVSLLA